MIKKPRCPVCSGEGISVATEERQILEGDTRLPYLATYSQCDRCGEEFYSREQARIASRAAADVLAAYRGRLGPSEIFAIRKKYDVTQIEMELILGLGKKSFGRWEAGLVLPSAAADQLLREVRDSPEMFRRWASKVGIELGATHSWSELLVTVPVTVNGYADLLGSNSVIYSGGPNVSFAGSFTLGKVGWSTTVKPSFSVNVIRASADREGGSASLQL